MMVIRYVNLPIADKSLLHSECAIPETFLGRVTRQRDEVHGDLAGMPILAQNKP